MEEKLVSVPATSTTEVIDVGLPVPAIVTREEPEENRRQKAAFEYYYSMGEKRSLNKVAEKIKVSRRSLVAWSVKFGWKKKIERRDEEIDKMLTLETSAETKELKKTVLGILREAIRNKAVFDENGVISGIKDLRIASMKDMREAVDLYREVVGDKADGSAQSSSTAVQVNLIIKNA